MADQKKFEGGIDKLGTIEAASDAHEAVGLWWAKAILRSEFDNGADDPVNISTRSLVRDFAAEQRSEKEAAIGGFAEALAHLSRERDLDYVHVDYHPDGVLMDAAELAEMPADGMMTFPWKTATSIKDGVVIAYDGYRGAPQQIWPPVPAEDQ